VTGRMTRADDSLYAAMLQRGMSRRTFIKFCTAMTAALALPATYAPRVAAAVSAAPRVPVIWLRGQGCGGDSAAFLGASSPTAAELLLDLLSVEYHEMIMAPAGAAAVRSMTDAQARYPHGYIAVVEGAIPTADGGNHCMVGGRPFRDVVRDVSAGALATIAVGSCACDGGAPAAAGGRTGAVGVSSIVSSGPFLALPGCPVNATNLTATIVHYLTFKEWPTTDSRHRPLFAYSGLIHNQCERRAHFEFGEFVLAWGDEAAQKGWCLYKMGCKGPETNANCPTARYADGTSWPVKAGHGCVGCTMPGFWDAMSPFYRRLPPPLPFAPTVSADQVGQALVGGVAGLTVVHGAASYVRQRRAGAQERREARAAAADGALPRQDLPGGDPDSVQPPVPAEPAEPAELAEPDEPAELAELDEPSTSDRVDVVAIDGPDPAVPVDPADSPDLEAD
jgi:hydrogenase small subunit